MESAITRNRRKAALFKTLSGWVAVPCALCAVGLIVIGQAAPSQPDALHIHRHSSRGAVRYLTEMQERIDFILMCTMGATLAISIVLALVYAWFKKREAQESQKQLLIDEFGPGNPQ
jgi:hypothetical protein